MVVSRIIPNALFIHKPSTTCTTYNILYMFMFKYFSFIFKGNLLSVYSKPKDGAKCQKLNLKNIFLKLCTYPKPKVGCAAASLNSVKLSLSINNKFRQFFSIRFSPTMLFKQNARNARKILLKSFKKVQKS